MDTGMLNNIAQNYGKTTYEQSDRTERTDNSNNVSKLKNTYSADSKTIGTPKLSEKAQDYYEKLKKKYSNMDFILVSRDQKEQAKASATKYANANRMVVLIDEDKIEKMAQDETYRKKYESIISGATMQLAQVKTGLSSNEACVKTFGMQVNDGGNASFFAVVDKSYAAQKKRIEKKAEQKALDKKKAQKEEEKKEFAERLEKQRTENASTDDIKSDKTLQSNNGDYVTVTASSAEELLKKINDILYEGLSDQMQTEAEKRVGQHIDLKG